MDCPLRCRECDGPHGYATCPQKAPVLIDRSSPYYLELTELKQAVEAKRRKRYV
jgi:hypothetical protein